MLFFYVIQPRAPPFYRQIWPVWAVEEEELGQ